MTNSTNQVALVTGAGTGLGRAIAKSLANDGFTVVLNGKREEKLREVEKVIGEDKFIVIPADVTNEESVHALKERLLELTGGKLNVLVNNVSGVPAIGSITELTLEQWQRVIDKNLTSQFLVTRAFLPTLRKIENGKIISVTSAMVHLYMNGFSAYGASKAGVNSLMKTIVAEEKENGIEVHLFDPSNVISESNPEGEKDPSEIVDSIIDMVK